MMTTTLYTGTHVEVWNINWSEARLAMIAAGFVPLVGLGGAEHWVRDSKRCILYIDGDVNDTVTDSVRLSDAAYVTFTLIGETLVAFPH